MRLQLCEPEAHPYLLKTVWGILMLLPQSPAYHTLKNRLAAVPELGLLRLQLAQSNGSVVRGMRRECFAPNAPPHARNHRHATRHDIAAPRIFGATCHHAWMTLDAAARPPCSAQARGKDAAGKVDFEALWRKTTASRDKDGWGRLY